MSKKKEKPKIEEPTAPFWMTTYGDMVTLILTFFILLISYSTIELEKFRGAMESLKGALGVFDGHESVQKKEYINFDNTKPTDPSDLAQRAEMLQEIILSEEMDAFVEFEIMEGGIMIRLGSEVLFDLGESTLKPQAIEILRVLMPIIQTDLKEIHVEGHTDDLPINTPRFPSNWELSAARAISVVRYFHESVKIPESMLLAVGRGEHRPLVPNNSEKNRQKNRRVEILIQWKKGT